MIPPCDASILEHNPQFKRLYETLTTTLLNPDGSTRTQDTDPARTAAVGDLKQCQTQSAKKRLKTQMLRRLAFASDSELPEKCHDNLAIISLYLETPRAAIELDNSKQDGDDNALSLLAPEIEAFYSHIPVFILPFSNLVSSAVHDLRTLATAGTRSGDADTDLATLASSSRSIPGPSRPTHNARARARDRRVRTSMAPVPPLSSQLHNRITALRHTQLSEMPAARRQMAATAAAVLAARTRVLERTVVILERAKHGALARATKAKAEHLATVAQGVEGKVEVTKLEITATLYTPETVAALNRYQQHLRETRTRLDERRAIAVEELKRYGDVEGSDGPATEAGADGGTLAEIARRYGLLVSEVETVKMEIARLGE
ncbi:hypothetical protein NUU61_003863 [Penicillium alfredii]|uniref:Uncharacterized protein n=1 Tax=Penicillium alfredii TaxID=1506179 RepID=A0A9W9KDA0_9EURO|nr:uncharacterized protein NUU61_003863 [Penicillium alfredii]KAJ5101641.1 hypothetical protein NUU61_003863 [Penicillium alfredii]